MIDFSAQTKALEAMLTEAPELDGWTIERSKLKNTDSGRCPWVGIYKNKVGYAPRRMGVGAQNWATELKIDIPVQASSTIDDAEETLEGQIKQVLDVIESDRTLRGTVNMILGYEVSYFINLEATEEVFYQEAVITVTAEVKS
jgi:hypothetical protein